MSNTNPNKKKSTVIDLNKYLDQVIRVKFSGGREVTGVLKGYDPLLNLVLDDTSEWLRDPFDPYKLLPQHRQLGLTVARGTAVTMLCPVDGTTEIANPFIQQESEKPVIE